jgi:ribonuclease HI
MLDSLRNNRIHTPLIEEIRRKVHEMENKDWKIRFRWIKGHTGTWGNEFADQLAKEAAANTDIPTCYSRVPKSVVKKNKRKRVSRSGRANGSKPPKGKSQKTTFRKLQGD